MTNCLSTVLWYVLWKQNKRNSLQPKHFQFVAKNNKTIPKVQMQNILFQKFQSQAPQLRQHFLHLIHYKQYWWALIDTLPQLPHTIFLSTCKDREQSAVFAKQNLNQFENRNLTFCGIYFCPPTETLQTHGDMILTWSPAVCLSPPFLTPAPPAPSQSGRRSLTPTGCLSHAGYWPGIHLRTATALFSLFPVSGSALRLCYSCQDLF